MISTRRALTAVLLAAGAAAIAAPAADAASLPITGGEPISPTATLDSVSTMAVPADQRAELPTASQQLNGLNRLNELHKATDLVAPVTNALPSLS
ncbi:hypothetical protein [Streptomyces beihaiensis]|uniref:Secreted protein n=1 Tax=Streptomyces beihaiensis TaxID=2984495 RepID=A0ABT3U078_9ACTN|nr:hypothetical protein [Streptomyces beihaiensis]MCX3062719.1 hypothetical protein [Streptomyces beihaiensis]